MVILGGTLSQTRDGAVLEPGVPNRNALKRLAEALAGAGYASPRYDKVGYGKSKARTGWMGSYHQEAEVAAAAIEFARQLSGSAICPPIIRRRCSLPRSIRCTTYPAGFNAAQPPGLSCSTAQPHKTSSPCPVTGADLVLLLRVHPHRHQFQIGDHVVHLRHERSWIDMIHGTKPVANTRSQSTKCSRGLAVVVVGGMALAGKLSLRRPVCRVKKNASPRLFHALAPSAAQAVPQRFQIIAGEGGKTDWHSRPTRSL